MTHAMFPTYALVAGLRFPLTLGRLSHGCSRLTLDASLSHAHLIPAIRRTTLAL